MGATPRLSGMTLTLTERCELRCTYCYVPVERGRAMSPEIVDRAIDLFAVHSVERGTISLSFFGGEPFLARDRMRQSIERARATFGERLRVVTPTNGMRLEGDVLDEISSLGIELALSIDGDHGREQRLRVSGAGSIDRLKSLLPGILALDPGARLIARMTVTNANVRHLFSNVRSLAAIGFRRIVWMPDVDVSWDDAAIDLWRSEHDAIARWIADAMNRGDVVPDFPALRAIERRIVQRRPRKTCGAGERVVAIATDGRIFPCHRFLFDRSGEDCVLGDVTQGFVHEDALVRFRRLDPERQRSEDGACSRCTARDGCTHFCPALGWFAARDVLHVPSIVCALMRAQVEAIRPYAPRARPVRRCLVRTSIALALGTVAAAGSASCGGRVDQEPAPIPAIDAADAADAGGFLPGLCADVGNDVTIGGLCPPVFDDDAAIDTGDASDAIEPRDSWGNCLGK